MKTIYEVIRVDETSWVSVSVERYGLFDSVEAAMDEIRSNGALSWALHHPTSNPQVFAADGWVVEVVERPVRSREILWESA